MKQNYLYKFTPHNYDVLVHFEHHHNLYKGMHAVCLGEIHNTPNHYVMACQNGGVVIGAHSIDWKEVVEQEGE